MSGIIDTTFGTSGVTTIGTTFSVQTNIVYDQNNNIIIGGTNGLGQYVLSRYSKDGVLDTTFGTSGLVTGHFVTGDNSRISCLTIDINNNIVAGGTSNISTPQYVVARFLPNGNLDNIFGSSGVVTGYYNGTDGATVKSIVIDQNHDIVLGGFNPLTNQYALVRLTPNGVLDTTFGTGGISLGYFSGTDRSDIYGLAIDQNNQIVAGGVYNYSMYAVAKFTATGSLDGGFGTGGVTTGYYSGTDNSQVNNIKIDANHNILIGGAYNYAEYALARFTSAGVLDTTFGTNGVVIGYFDGSKRSGLNSIAIDQNGQIIIGGDCRPQYALARFSQNGVLDGNFGMTGGIILSQFEPTTGNNASAVRSVSINNQNDIIAYGYAGNSGNVFYLTKYLSGGSSPPIPPEPPISDICFPGNTPIRVDQGEFPIYLLKPSLHTINSRKIVAITKTVSPYKHLVCIEAGAFGTNIPSITTVVSRLHKVCYNGRTLIESYRLVGKLPGVRLVRYSGEPLYNILLDEYGVVRVNNMICETLDPTNTVARIYTSKGI
jgi:uncharacterized delta-60 repeat protein